MHQLLQGDCLELMKDIPDGSVDLILADPPYETTRCRWDSMIPLTRYIKIDKRTMYENDFMMHCFNEGMELSEAKLKWKQNSQDGMWENLNRIIKPNGAIVLFGSGMYTAMCMQANQKKWKYNLIWEKTTPTGFLNANRMPLRSHEDIMVFYGKQPTYNPQKTTGHARKVSTVEHKRNCKATEDYGKHNLKTYDSTERFPKSVLTFKTDKQKCALHPTQKPVELLEWLIKTYSNENDMVLDFCAGSNSTGVACLHTNRNYIGIELDRDYFKIGKDRIEKEEFNLIS